MEDKNQQREITIHGYTILLTFSNESEDYKDVLDAVKHMLIQAFLNKHSH